MNSEPTRSTRSRRPLALALGVITVFAVLFALLLAGVMRSGRADRDALPSPLIGKPAPAFALPSLHEPERTIDNASLRGQPYLLNVWGSWCPACREEHPVLTRFAETRRVRVIGYNWNDPREDALRWLEQFGNPFWVVMVDRDSRYVIDWGIYGAPETFLVDARGIVRWKHVGPLTDAIIRDELEPQLRKLGVRR